MSTGSASSNPVVAFAVTRARRHLDPAGLAWIPHHPDNPRSAG
ncbi:hypothetical protein [Streptomyces niveus]